MIYILLIGGVLFVSGVFCAWVIFKAFGYIYSYFFWGAINVPTTDEKVEQIIKILDLKGKNKAVDLGSGDGRLIIALAKSGVEAHGYEINPFLVSLARKNIQKINSGRTEPEDRMRVKAQVGTGDPGQPGRGADRPGPENRPSVFP